jgi:thymidylate kinase
MVWGFPTASGAARPGRRTAASAPVVDGAAFPDRMRPFITIEGVEAEKHATARSPTLRRGGDVVLTPRVGERSWTSAPPRAPDEPMIEPTAETELLLFRRPGRARPALIAPARARIGVIADRFSDSTAARISRTGAAPRGRVRRLIHVRTRRGRAKRRSSWICPPPRAPARGTTRAADRRSRESPSSRARARQLAAIAALEPERAVLLDGRRAVDESVAPSRSSPPAPRWQRGRMTLGVRARTPRSMPPPRAPRGRLGHALFAGPSESEEHDRLRARASLALAGSGPAGLTAPECHPVAAGTHPTSRQGPRARGSTVRPRRCSRSIRSGNTASSPPPSAERKVGIIDGRSLDPDAQNALLKTLEATRRRHDRLVASNAPSFTILCGPRSSVRAAPSQVVAAIHL